jgi:YggT family protein
MVSNSFNLRDPLCALGNLYVLILIARAIFSWFPIRPDSGFAPVVRFLHAVTEPVLAPLRRVIPPLGMFDMSFLVALLGIEFLVVPLLCSIGPKF